MSILEGKQTQISVVVTIIGIGVGIICVSNADRTARTQPIASDVQLYMFGLFGLRDQFQSRALHIFLHVSS